MKLRHYLIAVAVFLLILLAALIVVKTVLDIHIVPFSGNSSTSKPKILDFPVSLNLLQTGNTCGAHSVMAMQYLINGNIEDPYIIYENIEEKLGNGYIYPWGLSRYLKKKSIESSIYYLGVLSNKGKEGWIKKKLNHDQPVIVIVGTRKYLHYITILGFDEKSFYIYDSLLENDKNKGIPGNITVGFAELLERMNSARYKGIVLNMAISG